MLEITKQNIYRKVGGVKKVICTWHSRNLTPYRLRVKLKDAYLHLRDH